jgi:hypothetical protein
MTLSEGWNVVVEMEQVGRIVAPLDLNQPVVIAAIRGPYPIRPSSSIIMFT